MKHIQIVAMRSWGELGNLLAAKVLAAALSTELEQVSVSIVEFDTILPKFAEVGNSISSISKSSRSPAEKYVLYHELINRFAEPYYPGFEMSKHLSLETARDVDSLGNHFLHTRPDVVVGTKGIITRLCFAAFRSANISKPIINYITNHGLLALPIHRSHYLPYNLVPLKESYRYLIEELGYSSNRVFTMGRLIAFGNLTPSNDIMRTKNSSYEQQDLSSLPTDKPFRMLVFSNRGGAAYLELLHHLATKHPLIPLIFISYNDPLLFQSAMDLCRRYKLDNWYIFDRLSQNDYIQYLSWLSNAEYSLLISKTGPNTMLEAAYFGVPVCLLYSGLPMEAWVIPFVQQNGLGHGFENIQELLPVLDELLADPKELMRLRQNAYELGEMEMNQQRVRQELASIFNRIMDQETPVVQT